MRTGCPWRYLPGCFPPWKTVYWYFHRWAAQGTLHRLHAALGERVRAQQGRDPRPGAAIIDSRSVRSADTAPASSRGRDSGKKVNGRKHRIAAAHRLLGLVWAGAGYAGGLETWTLEKPGIALEVVRKLRGRSTFVVPPRRWVVERSLAWTSKHRRCVRDYERLPAHHEAMVLWATTSHMLKRLT
ncbi:transposase [Nocardiopsis composta]|uniref:Transposase n=1 Tax=Nocardiopsis composta TaxID=157465 RepID=A0A7W8VG82_9ACTN|nr:transposase [Nocardiopsis composta]